VPDTIRSSTGPSGAISNGRAGVDADIPAQREKKLKVLGEDGGEGMTVELAVGWARTALLDVMAFRISAIVQRLENYLGRLTPVVNHSERQS
jgi:hypothetical protein